MKCRAPVSLVGGAPCLCGIVRRPLGLAGGCKPSWNACNYGLSAAASCRSPGQVREMLKNKGCRLAGRGLIQTQDHWSSVQLPRMCPIAGSAAGCWMLHGRLYASMQLVLQRARRCASTWGQWQHSDNAFNSFHSKPVSFWGTSPEYFFSLDLCITREESAKHSRELAFRNLGFEFQLLSTESGGWVPKAVQAPERKPDPKRRTPCCRCSALATRSGLS